MKRKAYYSTEDLENLTKTYDLTDVEEETDVQIVEVTSEDFADNSNFEASKFKTDDLDEILEYLAYQWDIYVGNQADDNDCFMFDFVDDGELIRFDKNLQADFISKVENYIKDNYVMDYDFQSATLTFDTRDISIWKEIIKNSFSSVEVSVTFTMPYWDDDNIDDDDVNNGEDFFYEGIEDVYDKSEAYINVSLGFEYND